MNVVPLAPTALALIGISAGYFLPRYLRPKAATLLLTAAVLATTVAIVAALAQVAMAAVSGFPAVARLVGWCSALYHGQHGAAPIAGLGAAGALVAMAVGAGRHLGRIHHEHEAFKAVDGVEVVDLDGPIAFAVPGNPGGVVLGTGLLARLDGRQRCAVLAHENAHLRLRHHRYVHLAELCAAGLPVLRPLSTQVRLMTERWADEVAAEAIGSRELLATTIALVALMPADARAAAPLNFGGGATVARVDALLHPRSSPMPVAVGSALAVAAAVVLGSTFQVHHLVTLLAHICPF